MEPNGRASLDQAIDSMLLIPAVRRADEGFYRGLLPKASPLELAQALDRMHERELLALRQATVEAARQGDLRTDGYAAAMEVLDRLLDRGGCPLSHSLFDLGLAVERGARLQAGTLLADAVMRRMATRGWRTEEIAGYATDLLLEVERALSRHAPGAPAPGLPTNVKTALALARRALHELELESDADGAECLICGCPGAQGHLRTCAWRRAVEAIEAVIGPEPEPEPEPEPALEQDPLEKEKTG